MLGVFEKLFVEQPVYFLIASISTTMFLVKLGLLAFGGLSKDFDLPVDVHDVDHTSAGQAFSFLSIQSLLGLLMGIGWMGLALESGGTFPSFVVAILASLFGISMMGLTAFLVSKLRLLNHQTQHHPWALIGSSGTVYLTVPPKGRGDGLVELVQGGAKRVLKAVNDGAAEIPSFVEIFVVGVDGDCLVIRRKE